VIKLSYVSLLLLIMPLVSAGFFDVFSDARDMVTGMATSGQTALSIVISNTAPSIPFVMNISSQSITEQGTSQVLFFFTANDSDGVANLNDTSAQVNFTKSGSSARTNSSCALVGDLDAYSANYSCTVSMWYWDAAGNWSINVSIRDNANAFGQNVTTEFPLGETTAMVMSPTSLSWGSMSLLAIDQLSNNDPIVINNTGNKNITAGNVKVTAIDMQGATITTEYLNSSNFTVSVTDACNVGVYMANNTATAITGATILAGNNSAGDGQEQLYFCLETVTPGISQQTYSTATSGAWTVGVS
jgi:hypothetical protein